MATITEDYVSFEVAKLLKEKGFDKDFDADIVKWYNVDGEDENLCSPVDFRAYKCPSQSMAMKWLREVHNIFIDICTLSPLAYTYRVCLISDTTGYFYEDYACEEGERFMSYEEAVEFALDYCLTNILEV